MSDSTMRWGFWIDYNYGREYFFRGYPSKEQAEIAMKERVHSDQTSQFEYSVTDFGAYKYQTTPEELEAEGKDKQMPTS